MMVMMIFSQIYRGYVDDPRNTDNAWMETVVMHFHDESGEKVISCHFRASPVRKTTFQVAQFPLQAGDDAVAICWMELSSEINLYASHRDFVKTTAHRLGAHW